MNSNTNKKNTSFLEEINLPKDLKKLKEKDLAHLCNEVREFMIDKVSKEFNLTKYQILILTWLEGILIGVLLCNFVF